MVTTALVAVGLMIVGGSPASAASVGITSITQLRNAPIPASCQHKAAHLRNFNATWGMNGSASLDRRHAVFVALGGNATKYAVVPLDCNAGGVEWPQLLLVYGAGPRLVGYVELPGGQEHSDVTAMTASKRSAIVRWESYEGAGFGTTTHRSTLTLTSGKVVLRQPGPLTVDFTTDGLDTTDWAGNYSGNGSSGLDPVPASLKAFVATRWRTSAKRCGGSGDVQVLRWSHKGYAVAINNWSCGVPGYELYQSVSGKWRIAGMWSYEYGVPSVLCAKLTKAQRIGLTAVHGACQIPPKSIYSEVGTARWLGTWPASGQ